MNAADQQVERVAMALLVAREGLDVPDSFLSDYERHLARAAIAALRPAMTDQPRFFIDHGQIHDRVTGKHVTTDEDTVFCDGINCALELLNGLAARIEALESALASEREDEALQAADHRADMAKEIA